MGVYIPNWKMPRNCSFCPCARMNISRNGIECSAVDFYAENLMPQKGRMECCPLVEVKPHGRLIEDTVLDTMSMWNTDREYDRGWDSAVQAAKNRIKTAPTIIEAEQQP